MSHPEFRQRLAEQICTYNKALCCYPGDYQSWRVMQLNREQMRRKQVSELERDDDGVFRVSYKQFKFKKMPTQ